MENTEITYIYILIDPRDNIVRYVGKTSRPKRRLKEHIADSKRFNDRKSRWINSLKKVNMIPIFKIIKVCPIRDFILYETQYIKLYKSNKLTNSDETGQGFHNRHRSIIRKISKNRYKKVYQYELTGNLIKVFNSIKEASISLNINAGNISKCCNDKFKHTGGFIFKFTNHKIQSLLNANAIRKSVIEIDKDNNPIKMWNSLMDCSRETNIDNGNLSKVCNNKILHIHNRIFRFGSIIN